MLPDAVGFASHEHKAIAFGDFGDFGDFGEIFSKAHNLKSDA